LWIANQFLVEIACAIATENHRNVRMISLAYFGYFQTAMSMGQPVEVNAKGLTL